MVCYNVNKIEGSMLKNILLIDYVVDQFAIVVCNFYGFDRCHRTQDLILWFCKVFKLGQIVGIKRGYKQDKSGKEKLVKHHYESWT